MTLVSRGKAWVTWMVLFSLLWTGAAAMSAPSASAAAGATAFSDVKADHWAAKHISKLALQGLIVGNNGAFRPSDTLKREEAVLIALRFAGLESKVNKNEATVFPGSFKVDTYFQPYVNYALKENLLDSTQEFTLAANEKGKEWGSAPATREWMAQLLVRAIGKKADADAKGTTATSFADNASIGGNYLGSVNVVVGLGIMTGVAGNKFDPKGNLTRAMAATLFDRAEPYVTTSFPGQATGIWLSVAADKLTMLHADGTTSVYTVDGSTLFSHGGSEALMTADTLKAYGKALVISTDGNRAAYAEQLDDTPQVNTVEGEMVVANTSAKTISLLIGQDIKNYNFDPANPPATTDAEGNAITLADIPTGTSVKLLVDAFSSNQKVLTLSLKSSLASKKGTGTIVGVDAANGTVQFKDDAASAAETRSVSSVASIQKDGGKATLADLKAGDVISFEVKNGALTSIVVTKSSATTSATGFFYKIDKNDQTISYTSAQGSTNFSAKYYATNVSVSLPNGIGATLDDLYKGDAITMTLDGDGKVTAIAVGGRSFTTWSGATIADYAPSSGFLIVKSADGKSTNAFSMDANTKYDYNGTAMTKETALRYIAKGVRVNVGFNGTQLVYVSFISQYAGTVVKNDATARSLTLQLDDGSVNVTVYYGTPVVEIYGNANANYTNVGQGDRVVVQLDGYQAVITAIQVWKSAQFEVVSIDAAGGKLTVKDSAGTTANWTLASGVAVLDENGKATALSNFAVGSTFNASYLGKTLKSIKYVPVVYGKVTALDAAAGTLTLQQGAAAPVVLNVGATASVTKNGSTVNSLAALAVNDRVEIRKNEYEAYVLTAVAGVSKTVWYAEPDTLKLNFQKVGTLTDDLVKVSPTAYIHQGVTTIGLGNLANGDAVTVYIVRNKAVEIEKTA